MHSLYFHGFSQELHYSICRNCFATVSSQQNEKDLDADEDRHVCDPECPWLRGVYPDMPLNGCILS
jgi:hypothetical protein